MELTEKLKPKQVLKETGKPIEFWYEAIEKFGPKKGHTAKAKHLEKKFKISTWWSRRLVTHHEFQYDLQKEYDRKATSNLSVSVRKTINAGIIKTYNRFSDTDAMKKWLSPYIKVKFKVGGKFNFEDLVDAKITAIEERKCIKLNLLSKGNEEVSEVVIDFVKKEGKKTVIKITQSNLSTQIAVDAQTDIWKNLLSSFKKYIES